MSAPVVAARLPKISEEEKQLMQKWLAKEHNATLNARWIKGGGGAGTHLIDAKQVKTSGAYEALAVYMNKKLESKPKKGDKEFWTAKIASTRFAAAFKAYSDACKIGSKSDSAAGANEDEVARQVNYNNILLAQQIKKCPMFATFQALYSEHPTVHPVMNVGMQEGLEQGEIGEGDIDGGAEGGAEGDAVADEESEDESKKQQAAEVASATASTTSKPKVLVSATASTTSKPKEGTKKEEVQKKAFLLKEGQKKQEFTTVWAATMGQSRQDKLDFEKQEAKRRRTDAHASNKIAKQKVRTDLMIAMVQKGMTFAEIRSYMAMAGFSVTEPEPEA